MACGSGRELVEQILSFARAGTIERRRFDVRDAFLRSCDLLRGSLPSSTEMLVSPPDAALPTWGNEAQIGQVILNLAINASDSLKGEPGRVALALTRVDPGAADYERQGAALAAPRVGELAMGALDPGAVYARLELRDTGPGIAPKELLQIFEPFFTTKERGRGTGLGLAVVDGVVRTHKGAYRVETAIGKGTAFFIYLPLAEGAAPGVMPPSEPGAVRGSETVLVVDDDAAVLDMMVTGLERLGYEAVGVDESPDALEVIAEDPAAWHVLVTDQVMPRLKGLALIEEAKRIHPGLVAILCTGFSDRATEEALPEGIADAVFMKPVSPNRVAAAIRALVTARAPASPESPP
jgi:two-component system, cell cycle sensor histidine kinase and response regulator CckA